jgi:uncharacterized repeat protein (TIGR02543 family)
VKNWKIILAFTIVMALFVILGVGALKVYGQCSGKYDEGTEVILTATPCPGYSFTGWSGDCVTCGKSRSCKVVMAADRTCKANFMPMPIKPRLLPPENLRIGTELMKCDNCKGVGRHNDYDYHDIYIQ